MVIGIISVLIGAIGVSLNRAQTQKRDSQRIRDVLAISKAIDQFSETHRGYYPAVDNIVANPWCGANCWSDTRIYGDWYGSTYPRDPSSPYNPYGYVNCTLSNFSTNTICQEKMVRYFVRACLEDRPNDDLKGQLVVGDNTKCQGSYLGQNAYYIYGPYCGISSTSDVPSSANCLMTGQ